MRRTPRVWSGLGLLTLASALPPVPAWAAGPEWVSLVRKDDNFHQAWTLDTGPNHEARPDLPTVPAAVERVARAPLPPIVENPLRPPPSAGSTWVRGYWRWDTGRNDFVWVPGLWVTTPPGKFWVDGDWKRDDRGWYRVAGFWSTRRLPTGSDAPPAAEAPPPAAPESLGQVASAATALTPATTTRTVARRQIVSADLAQTMTLPLSSPAPATEGPEAVPPGSPATPSPFLPVDPAVSPAGETPPPVDAPPPPTPIQPEQAVSSVVATPQSVDQAAPSVVVSAPAPAPVPVPTTMVVSTYPLVALADQLAGQAAAFEQVFGRTARVTPGGGAFLAEARQIRGAALGLRQAAAAGDTYRAALAYREVNYAWQRMAARVNQIAPGRSGPNIQQIWAMGGTTSQIGSLIR